jgi:hypothetical protein
VTDNLRAMVNQLNGAAVPGGCDHCDAYQLVHAHAHGRDLHTISVYHDGDCPWLAARQATP